VAAKYDEWLTDEGLLRIQGWARDGLTDKDIAKNMRIGLSTIKEWKNKFPQIREALRIGKDAADRVVENALYKSATGYTVTVKRPVKVRQVFYDDETGKKLREVETWVQVEEEIAFPANTTAQIFWLKNRKPVQWRDKTDQQVSFSNGVLESLMDLRREGES
jgi:hypothetical protein